MAQLNSPLLNLTPVSPRKEPAPLGSAASAKEGPSSQDFAQMMAGVLHAKQAAAPGGATKQAPSVEGDQPASVQSAQTLIKDIQGKLKELQAQQPQSPAVSAGLEALKQQLTALNQRLSGGTEATGTQGASLDTLVAQLQKIQGLLDQGTGQDSAWAGQIQAAALMLTQVFRGESRTGATSSVASAHIPTATDSAAARAPASGQAGTPQTAFTASTDGQAMSNSDASKNNNQASAGSIGLNASGNKANNNSVNNLITNQVFSAALASLQPGQNGNKSTVLSPTAPGDASGAGINPAAAALNAIGFGSSGGPSLFTALPGVLDLNHPKMPEQMGQQIQWMVGKNFSKATLTLNPANLGPLKITIDLQQNQTHIQLLAAHHMTRDLLEQSLPRLREYLQEAGLSNAQVSIGQDAAQGQAQNQAQGQSDGQNLAGGARSSYASGAASSASTDVADQALTLDQSGSTAQGSSRWRLDTFV